MGYAGEPKLIDSRDLKKRQVPKEDASVEAVCRFAHTIDGYTVADIMTMAGQDITPIGDRLAEVSSNVIGFKTRIVAESQEVTILADKSVPFSVIKKVLSTCTSQGFGRISLAVLQKTPETSQS